MCCCGLPSQTCAQAVLCRPAEIWISYTYTARLKRIVTPAAGATGNGGTLWDKTESFSGLCKFKRVNPGFGDLNNTLGMSDYEGNWNYSQTTINNGFADYQSCPSSCPQCLTLVPKSRNTITGTKTWTLASNGGVYGLNAYMMCQKCTLGTNAPARPLAYFKQEGGTGIFTGGYINYFCNGSIQSQGSTFVQGTKAPFYVEGRPGCLSGTTFNNYYIARESTSGVDYVEAVPYPYCVTQPGDCDVSTGQFLNLESDFVSDCYTDTGEQRPCYQGGVLIGGCGCDPFLPNPYPAPGFGASNACYTLHDEYTMTSSVNVTNVIP